MIYKTNRIHTYSDMMREAIAFIIATDSVARPITAAELMKMNKTQLREYYCYLKNKNLNNDN